jgi:hypothetical protein
MRLFKITFASQWGGTFEHNVPAYNIVGALFNINKRFPCLLSRVVRIEEVPPITVEVCVCV